jgi:hypothetical protein
VTGNQAGAEHLAELDAHLESHLAEVRRRAQHADDELGAEIDALAAKAAPPPRRPAGDFDFDLS